MDSGSRTPLDVQPGALHNVISIDDLQGRLQQLAMQQDDMPMRLGVMGVFHSLADLESQMAWILTLFERHEGDEEEEPINVLNLAVRLTEEKVDLENDSAIVAVLREFVAKHRDDFFAVQIRRITFVVNKKASFPKYFTFRQRLLFEEDAIYRHVDPALAFKLGMFRLANYDVELCPTRNPQLHLYFATGKAADGRGGACRRFFARTIMRHPDFLQRESSPRLMQQAGERLLLEALDELELVFNNPKYRGSDCNHVFINFVPMVELDPEAYSKDLESLILRYGERLWHLRVLEAEIRMNVRPQKHGRVIPVRFTVSNLSGYNLNIHIYREVANRNGQAVFRNYTAKNPGPWHGGWRL